MPYVVAGEHDTGRLSNLAYATDFSVDCKQDTTVLQDRLPLRLRLDNNLTDASTSSIPSTSSTTFTSPDQDDAFEISSASSYDSDNGLPEQHHNPRRTAIGATPPSLQRCDYKHRTFVEGLLAVTTSFVETIWPLSRETPRSSTEFNGAGVLPLRTFIQETCRRSKTSYSTLQIALYYLVLLKEVLPDLDFTREQPREPVAVDTFPTNPQVLLGESGKPNGCRMMQCGRRMFMSALMLAAKYLQDRNFSCKAWARISGLSCMEINQNERAYLQSIGYRLHLKKEYFDNWSQIVLNLCQLSKQPGSLDYLKLIRRLKPEIIHDPANTKFFLNQIAKGSYHPGCASGSSCFYPADDNTGPESMRMPLHPTFEQTSLIQTSGRSVLRAGPDLATKDSIHSKDQASGANTRTCPPPRPVSTDTSSEFYSRRMQQTAADKFRRAPFSDIPPGFSLRPNDELVSASIATFPPGQPRKERYLSVSATLGKHIQSPLPTPPLTAISASPSPDSKFDSIFSDDPGMAARPGSYSMLSYDWQQRGVLGAKPPRHTSPLRNPAIAGVNDDDSGYGSQAETMVYDESSDSNVPPEESEIVARYAKRKAPSELTVSENAAAATLMMLSNARAEQSRIISKAEDQMLTGKRASKRRGPPKSLKPGHTSEHTKARRQKERANSRTDKTHQSALDTISPVISWSSSFTLRDSEEEKVNQVGHKYWAETRRPVLSQDNPDKRRAITAADLASATLKGEVPRHRSLTKSR